MERMYVCIYIYKQLPLCIEYIPIYHDLPLFITAAVENPEKGAIVGAPSATGAAGCYLTGWMDYKPTNIAGNLFVSGCPSRDFHHFLLPI